MSIHAQTTLRSISGLSVARLCLQDGRGAGGRAGLPAQLTHSSKEEQVAAPRNFSLPATQEVLELSGEGSTLTTLSALGIKGHNQCGSISPL